MKPPSDFVVPTFRKLLAYTHDTLVHVREKEVYYADLEGLPKSKTLIVFKDFDESKKYTRECILLQVVQNKDLLKRIEKRWESENSVTVLAHMKFKSKAYSQKDLAYTYKFADVDNRPVRIAVPDRLSNLTDAGDIRRLQSMEVDHCYVMEIEYAFGVVDYAKLLADTTSSKRMGKPTWLQDSLQP